MEQDTKSTVVKVGAAVAGVVILAVALPLIYAGFLASLGLLGIAITGLVGVAGFKALPYLAQKWDNTVLGLRKAEARANPIEQCENKIIADNERIRTSEQAYTMIKAQIQSMVDMVKDQKKTDPGYDDSDEQKSLADMQRFAQALFDSIGIAKQSLEDFKVEVKRLRLKFKFAAAGANVMNQLGQEDVKSITESMLKDEAFQSVLANYNKTMAALDLKTQKISSAKSLSFGSGLTLDVSHIVIPERLEVK